MRIATGEKEEELEDDGKDPAAKALGAKGGAGRARKLTPVQRKAIAAKAAAARWKDRNSQLFCMCSCIYRL